MSQPVNNQILDAAQKRLKALDDDLAALADPQRAAAWKSLGADLAKALAYAKEARELLLRQFPALGSASAPSRATPPPLPPPVYTPAFATGPPMPANMNPAFVSNAAAVQGAAAQAGGAAATAFSQLGNAATKLLSAASLMSRGALGAPNAAWGAIGGPKFAGAAGAVGAAAQPIASQAAGLQGLLAAADPFRAFPTFEGSVKSLSIAVGSSLIPVMNDWSASLQRTAAWVDGLDEGLKSNIARYGAYSIAGAAAAATLWKVAASGVAATKAVYGLGVAMFTTPLGQLTLLAGAAVGAAYAYDRLGKSADDAGRALEGAAAASGPAGPAGRAASRDAIKSAEFDNPMIPEDLRKRLQARDAASNPAATRAAIAEFQKRAMDELDKVKAAQTAVGGADPTQKRADELMKPEVANADSQAYLRKRADEIEASRQRMADTDTPMTTSDYSDKMRRAANDAAALGTSRVAPQLRREGFAVQNAEVQTMLAERLVRQQFGERAQLDLYGKQPTSAVGRLPALRVNDSREYRFERGEFRPTRIRPEDEGRPRPLPTLGSMREGDLSARLERAQAIVNVAADFARRGGVEGGMKENWKGPQAQISDPMAMMDRIQLSALNQGDLDSEHLQKQLANATDTKDGILKVHTSLEKILLKMDPTWR